MKCDFCDRSFDSDYELPAEREDDRIMCERCDEKRAERELLHAHPESPGTVVDYLRQKGAT